VGSGKIGVESAFQQLIGAVVIARTDRRDGIFLDCRGLWIIIGRIFGALEQGKMPRRDLAQLGIEILYCNVLFPEDAKKCRHRRIGDAQGATERFMPNQQLGRD
jgi:hypothetical protein